MAKQGFFQQHWVDENGNPAGGVSTGKGFAISWQNGPLGRIGTGERREPNGAFVEDVVGAVKGRFEFYQEVYATLFLKKMIEIIAGIMFLPLILAVLLLLITLFLSVCVLIVAMSLKMWGNFFALIGAESTAKQILVVSEWLVNIVPFDT